MAEQRVGQCCRLVASGVWESSSSRAMIGTHKSDTPGDPWLRGSSFKQSKSKQNALPELRCVFFEKALALTTFSDHVELS